MKNRKKTSRFVYRLRVICLTGFICTITAWGFPVQSQETTSEESTTPAAITTEDIEIPVDELELLVKPLTKQELEVEAQAWLLLLKEKVTEISNAEIAIKRKNREAQQAQEAVEALEEAQKKLEQANEAEDNNTESSQKVEEAQEALEEAQEAVEEAVKAEEQIQQDEQLQEAVDSALEEQGDEDKKLLINQGEETVGVEEAQEATENIEEAAASLENIEAGGDDADTEKELEAVSKKLEEAAESTSEVKTQLVVNVTELQEQRVAIVDRFNAVLEELQEKGGEVEAYDLYIKSVSGIDIDVTDTEGLWVRVVGWIQSEEGGLRWLVKIATFVGIVTASVIVAPILRMLTNRSLALVGGISDIFRLFIVRVVWQGTIVLGVFLALTAIEVNLGPVLALIGGASFILAFALQSNLGNLASGLMIMLYKPFDVGDEVKLGDIWGFVDSIGLANTKVRGFSGQISTLPNNSVWGSVITNNTAGETRAVSFSLKVGYNEDIPKIQELLLDVIRSHPLVLKTPAPSGMVWELADYYVNVLAKGWTKNSDYWTAYSDLMNQIKARLEQEGIAVPTPKQRIQVEEGFNGKTTQLLTETPEPVTASNK
ncbi:MAG: mechanosensitive ion channel [Symploca sp. SIO3C6]|nr:mechanosensitive ion channel [Symploca sp. SIO3C6]